MTTTKKTSRKSSTKRTTRKDDSKMRSFRIARNTPPFMTMKFTRQTVYWSILLAFIVIMQLWLLKIQIDIVHLTDSINVWGIE